MKFNNFKFSEHRHLQNKAKLMVINSVYKTLYA